MSKDLLKKANIDSKTAMNLYRQGNYETAFELAKELKTIYESLELWDKSIAIRNLMGINLEQLVRLEEAIGLLKETLLLGKKYLEGNHSELISTYNILGMCYCDKGDYNTSHHYYKLALELSFELLGENHPTMAQIYSSIANVLYEEGRYNESITLFQKSINLLLPQQEHFYNELIGIYANYAMVHIHKGDYDNSLIIAQKALDIAKSSLSTRNHMVAGIFNKMSLAYGYKGEYKQAILYLQKALDINIQTIGEYSSSTAACYHNIAHCYGKLEDKEKQIHYLQIALKIQTKTLGSEHRWISNTYASIGDYYIRWKDYKKALDYYQTSLNIRLNTIGEQSDLTAKCYNQISATYREMNDIESAFLFSHKALAIYTELFGTSNPRIAFIYDSIAQCYEKKKEYDQALEYYHQGIEILVSDFKSKSIYEIPLLKQYNESVLLLKLLEKKATIFHLVFEQEPNASIENITASLQYLQVVVQLMERVRQGYRTQDSQMLISKQVFSVFQKGLEVALIHKQHFKQQKDSVAFWFGEKAKAALLLSTQQDAVAKTTTNIPQLLVNQEKQLKIELTYLEKSIQKEETKREKKNEELIQKWQNEFFNFHQEYTQLLQQLETDYPNYYQLKYDTKTVTPTELQSTLQENQVVISYFVGEDKLYIFVVTSDEFEVIDLQLPNDFEALIEGFMAALTQHQFTAFTEKGTKLYQLLIAPIRDFIVDDFGFDDEELKQVFLIPYGVLSYLPFEALIEQPLSRFPTVDKVVKTLSTVEDLDNSLNDNSWSNLGYLIHHCQISYHYSATLLYRHLLKKQTEEGVPNSFAGFAPIYDASIPSKSSTSNLTESIQKNALQESAKSMQAWATRSEAIRSDGTWVSLPHSETEAKGIAELFEEKGLKAEIFLREKASKEGFAEAAKRFKFLLVAAHGLVNDEKTALSGLVFYPPQPLSRHEAVDKAMGNSSSSEKHGDISESEKRTHHKSPITNHQTDSVLSMEETHHLDLQADLVVLSSCESGIGTLHKGEGMMAVNRGFLAAGANNVVSTLFKVYDKPSSLLTQYLFEGILDGMSYSKALRFAKLELMEQPNIDPKSWSGFVLIGG